MSENKTKPTDASVENYLSAIGDQTQERDARSLVKLMEEATGENPVMWGASIIGFGTNHYKYESGREGDICAVGFSARKKALTIYGLFASLDDKNVMLAGQLGTKTMGKGCVYIKELADVDTKILKTMVTNAYKVKTTKGYLQ